MLKWLMIPLGLVMLLAGFLTFWLPIPTGLPLLLLGLALLLRYSKSARRLLVRWMRRYPALRRWLRRRGRHGAPTET